MLETKSRLERGITRSLSILLGDNVKRDFKPSDGGTRDAVRGRKEPTLCRTLCRTLQRGPRHAGVGRLHTASRPAAT